MVLMVRFAIVFQQDGLDKDWVRDELTKLGAKVVDETDGTIENKEHEEVPIWIYVCEGSLSAELLIKLKFNCYFDNHWLWPREPGETRSPFVGEA